MNQFIPLFRGGQLSFQALLLFHPSSGDRLPGFRFLNGFLYDGIRGGWRRQRIQNGRLKNRKLRNFSEATGHRHKSLCRVFAHLEFVSDPRQEFAKNRDLRFCLSSDSLATLPWESPVMGPAQVWAYRFQHNSQATA